MYLKVKLCYEKQRKKNQGTNGLSKTFEGRLIRAVFFKSRVGNFLILGYRSKTKGNICSFSLIPMGNNN